MTPLEFTAIKLTLSAVVALISAFMLENHALLVAEGKKQTQSWWDALGHYPSESLALLFGGGLFVLIFQVNITWLAGLTSATAVGIVGEVKVVPQWIFNALFNLKLDLGVMNILGAIVSIAGSALYAIAASQPQKLVLSFQWQLREGVEEKLTESLAESTRRSTPEP